ncbi:class F sortase [Paraoerskovia marina]|uniref:class F sortase n=1 Tax=Paraoerskovia marina TaxID=545619 RepID=UPI0005B9196B|nr:class F sortase [Paraoerskovia marina]
MRHSTPAKGSARRATHLAAVAGLLALLALLGVIALGEAYAEGPGSGAGPEPGPTARAEPAPSDGTTPPPSDDAAATTTAVPDVPVRAATPEPDAPDPTRLVVEGLDIDVPVEPEGVDPDGTMSLPESGTVAGWYQYAAAPGDDTGTVVLASHVDTYDDGLGEFARLTDAAPGDSVTLTDTEGNTYNYTVETVEQTAKVDVPLDELFDRTGDRRLVMVTCGGRWDADVGHYEDNVIVTAVPQS